MVYKIGDKASITKTYTKSDVEMFAEISFDKTSIVNQNNPKWFPYNSGGEFRRGL